VRTERHAACAGPSGAAFMFVWLRLSSQKLLDWARKGNYQPKDMAWTQKVIAERITEKVCTPQHRGTSMGHTP
jgi:alpha-glucan,water dikinase